MPGFNIGGEGYGFAPDPKSDPLRSYRWVLSYLNVAGDTVRVPSDIAFKNFAEIMVPELEFETETISGMSLDYKFPRKAAFNDIDIVFYDVIGLQKTIEGWMNYIWDTQSGLKLENNYKGDIEFQEVDHNGDEVAKFELHNAWPKKLSHSKLSMSDNSIKMITVSFAYDWYNYSNSGRYGGKKHTTDTNINTNTNTSKIGIGNNKFASITIK